MPKDPFASSKKIGVQYASINGNGFGGYGEIVFGTKGTLVLERGAGTVDHQGTGVAEQRQGRRRRRRADAGHPGQRRPDRRGQERGGGPKVSRGYTEELEHWAWCIRHPRSENQPRCGPKAAMADAVIALTANMAARSGKRIEFKQAWFDITATRPRRAFLRPAEKREHCRRRLPSPITATGTIGDGSRHLQQIKETLMFLSPEDRAIGKENFCAAVGSKPIRRDLLKKTIKTEVPLRQRPGAAVLPLRRFAGRAACASA